MMIIENLSSFYLLLLSNALMLAAVASAVIRFRRQCRRFEQFWNSPTGASLADEQSDFPRKALLAHMRLEERLSDMQRKVSKLTRRAPSRDLPAERPLPLDNAIRMAKLGAKAEDLTRSCGLNLGEARLLSKLHDPRARAASD